jgi:hypothetical protein
MPAHLNYLQIFKSWEQCKFVLDLMLEGNAYILKKISELNKN